MKLDVVVSFYQRPHYWPLVSEGLHLNREHIERVIVVNDEPWTEEAKLTFWQDPIVWYVKNEDLLDHAHEGYGVSKSINQGVKAATTPFVLVISDDIALAPDALARQLPGLRAKTLIYGHQHVIDPDYGIKNPMFLWRDDGVPNNVVEQPRALARGGFFICDREAHIALGGVDERFREYGWEEFDYLLRWMYEYGPNRVLFGPGEVYHLGMTGAEHPRAAEDSYNFVAFQESFARLKERYPTLGLREKR